MKLAGIYDKYTSLDYVCPFCEIEIPGAYQGFKDHFFGPDPAKFCKCKDLNKTK